LQIKLSLESDENSQLARNRDELVEKNVNLNAEIARLETLKAQLATDQTERKEDIARLSKDKRSLQQQLAEQAALKQTLQQEIAAVAQVRDQLAAANQSLAQDKQTLEGQATSLSEAKASLTGQLEAVGEQYKLTKVELETLRAEYADEVAAFKQERDLLKENLEALEILKARNTKREYEYNRLIRPKRSEQGRYVVRVHYLKDESGYRYKLNEPGDDQFREVTLSQLHEQLKALKQKHGSKLFVKVWFPDGTDLTHDESWSFANRIHLLYDYYYSKN
jgi:chromosome segregation ATPase